MADARDALIAELRQMNEQLGRLVAQQQSVIGAQQKLIAELEQRLAERDATHASRAAELEAEVRRLERELLGPKTERIKISSPERDLGGGEPDEEELARRREEAARKRRENAIAKQQALAADEAFYPVSDEQKRCPKCNGTRFGALKPETSTTIEYIPGRFVRRTHRREKLACSCGECILVAPAPLKLIAGGHYGFGFAAFLIVEKCVDSIPIHRIERRFQRLGIPISRATMNDLLHAAAERARPLITRLQKRVAALDIVLADETSMRLQDRKTWGFIWVFHGRDETSSGELVLYVFAVDRSGETPAQILGGTRGTLVVDGYTGYNNVTDPEGRARGGCWSHLRRKAFEARSEAIGIVGSPEHLALRQEKSRPIVDDFFDWVLANKDGILPKSPLAAALGYAINQRKRLELFLSDPRIPIHNNSSERRLRVVALGRKNFLFFGNPRAGRNIAGLYSLVG
ncbi:MAG TPA: IS66 family transposase, partial [Polyangiaceae bacterium]